MNREQKMNHARSTVAILGLGNVGLNLLVNSAQYFYQIIGIDNNPERIRSLKSGKSYLDYVSNTEISSLKNTLFTTDYSSLKNADIICLCLPTSSNGKSSQTEVFEKALLEVLKFIKPNTLIISESTLPIGFHSDFIIPTINNSFKLGQNLFLGFSPERINPGKKSEYTQANARIFTGFCEKSKLLTRQFYQHFIPTLHEMSDFKAAEFTKIFENAYRALNIAFVDEMKSLTDKLDLDIYEIINGAKSKGMSFEAHFPSAGIGGACIPMALDYLEEIALKTNSKVSITHQAKVQNQNKIDQIINSIKGYKKILILGTSYKKNLADLTRSSTLSVIQGLEEFGLDITLCDPHFNSEQFFQYNIHFINSFEDLKITQYDAVLLMVEHQEFDLQKIKRDAQTLIDPKGICSLLKI